MWQDKLAFPFLEHWKARGKRLEVIYLGTYLGIVTTIFTEIHLHASIHTFDSSWYGENQNKSVTVKEKKRNWSLFLGNYNLSANIRLIICIKTNIHYRTFQLTTVWIHTPFHSVQKRAQIHVIMSWFKSKRTFILKAI